MSWNSTVETDLTSSVQDSVTSAQTSLTVITNQTESQRQNEMWPITEKQALVDMAKANVESQIKSIKEKTTTITNIIDALYESTQTIQRDIANKLTTEVDKKQTLSEKETLNAIRMEQANALKNKYAGNYHSSWLGIWRPLTDESRMGLFVLSIVLGIIGLLTIIYLLLDPVSKILPVAIQEPSSIIRQKLNRDL